MGNLIKLVLIAVVGILVYNSFYGTDAEKETSRKVFGEVKDVWVAVGDLLRTEKQKFDEGKYDTALDKISDSFDSLKEKAKEINDSELLDKIAELDQERKRIQERLEETKEQNREFAEKGQRGEQIPSSYEDSSPLSEQQEEEFDTEIRDLIQKAKEAMEQAEKKE